uniref:Uncharacterized protein n=2 Tax=Caenorhabditis japonica TaxID=281687 RepID=A0A8R1DTV2_CAEJA
MVMRHSERLDDCCQGWIERCNKEGQYEPFDLNMPSKLPVQRALRDFSRDTCLTRSGVVLSQMVGRGLLMTDNTPDLIYCSPSLRCIQTATWVRDMSGSQALLRVEPGLFENFQYPHGVPRFLTPLQRLQFPVDKAFRPFMSLDAVVGRHESNDEYNKRIQTVLRTIAQQEEVLKEEKELKVLVVAHASTVDMAVGLLREKPRFTSDAELDNIAVPVPYCAMVYLKKFSETLHSRDKMMNFEVSTTKQIGVGLTSFGFFFIFLGVLMFLDSALLAIGNLLFIVGITFIIGVQRTLVFFFELRKLKGSVLFFGGILVVLFGYPLFGMIAECWGFILLFGGFLPGIVNLLRSIPGISTITYLPGIRQFHGSCICARMQEKQCRRFAKGAELVPRNFGGFETL